MRKTMMLAAMVAMVMLLAAAPAMAATRLSGTAILNQQNRGDVVAINVAEQEQEASQYQYSPGGAGGAGGAAGEGGAGGAGGDAFDIDIDGGGLQDAGDGGEGGDGGDDATGGEGGDGGAGGSQYLFQNQDLDQEATAEGPTFDATQRVWTVNVVRQ